MSIIFLRNSSIINTNKTQGKEEGRGKKRKKGRKQRRKVGRMKEGRKKKGNNLFNVDHKSQRVYFIIKINGQYKENS